MKNNHGIARAMRRLSLHILAHAILYGELDLS